MPRDVPSTEGLLQCYFYTDKELPQSMRLLFELPGDPYDENPEIAKSAISYLNELGVIFYRDEMHEEGILPNQEYVEKNGFPAWKYSVVLDYEELRVEPWEEPSQEIIAKNGDDRAWLEWGNPQNILSMDKFIVRIS